MLTQAALWAHRTSTLGILRLQQFSQINLNDKSSGYSGIIINSCNVSLLTAEAWLQRPLEPCLLTWDTAYGALLIASSLFLALLVLARLDEGNGS